MSRRPSISIHDYPEHLNPFNDDTAKSQLPTTNHPRLQRENSKSSAKEMKHKFWTFGRSRKKRSNSFSIKSTWNGLFGKRKESDQPEKRSTIITVSSAYKREPPFDRPTAPPRSSKDQQEFDEALGTLVRRRKYTMDSSGSRYSSSLTVNGDPARIYDGSPQDTTTSIMGDLTPKAPARRFGQVSPRPTDKIPPLNFDDKESKENGTVMLRERSFERTPVPPIRRSATRSSQRLNISNLDLEEDTSRSGDVTLRDENENVPDDYVFKRFGQDSVRRSNISINSCVSIGSTASGYGRKKRRAPQPPRRAEQLETPEENEVKQTPDTSKVELEIAESIDISRVTENIDEMTKRNQELIETSNENKEDCVELISKDETIVENVTEKSEEIVVEPIATLENIKSDDKDVELEENQGSLVEEKEEKEEKEEIKETSDKDTTSDEQNLTNKEENQVVIEYCRKEEDKMEIIKDIDEINSKTELEVSLRRKDSADRLSREETFSVQEEIKKIEKQIQALESKNSSKDTTDDITTDHTSNTRLSILANRRHFFQNMVDTEEYKDGVKIEFKELPREQKDIHVIKLTDSPVPVEAPKDPVKVIELHISEPIRQRPEILDDVNPIPKPRRHNSLSHNGYEVPVTPRERSRNSESFDKRGKSV